MTFKLRNREYADLGMEFSTYLMDEKKRCTNNCIFCFIDQNPKGMRETVYFKDDDERLSFLQGNYVTLTNMRESDVERIIRMHISPINVSVHTMNPDLRVKMMGNRFAGEKLRFLKMLDDGGIRINAQLVLCRDINDGEELTYSLNELCKLENLESLAAVPCGMTAHREGLPEILPYHKESAADVIRRIEKKAAECLEAFGCRKVFASDEFYLTAEKELPPDEAYEGYPQLENGVGMLRLHTVEFEDALADCETEDVSRHLSIATGMLAKSHMEHLASLAMARFPSLRVDVHAIVNHFFGETITVSGLVTGGDLIAQLRGKELGDTLLIPENMLRHEGDLFLDNVSVADVENALHVTLGVTSRDGEDLLHHFLDN
jgi:putative radical SAM enzyme (TIGR03279 family)